MFGKRKGCKLANSILLKEKADGETWRETNGAHVLISYGIMEMREYGRDSC